MRKLDLLSPLLMLAESLSIFYMRRFKSIKTMNTLLLIKQAARIFERKLEALSNDPLCLDADFLKKRRIIKRKYWIYGSYLAALNSVPVLFSFKAPKETLACIFAKTSAINAIKVLDNLNDHWQSKEQAAESLLRALQAFIGEPFPMNLGDDFIGKAENSVYNMAKWTYDTIREYADISSYTFKLYISDLLSLREGQEKSLEQKIDEPKKRKISIQRYLREINEKSVGRVWIDIDFCFYEALNGGLDRNEREAIKHVRLAMDYLFKASNIYDDVTDLEEDLRNNIINSVGLLAVDQGYLSMKDLLMGEKSIRKLKMSRAIEDTIHLADMILLEGIRHLYEARALNDCIDFDALIFSSRISRVFCLRKWFMREISSGLKNMVISFQRFESYRIPEHIRRYEKYIRNEENIQTELPAYSSYITV